MRWRPIKTAPNWEDVLVTTEGTVFIAWYHPGEKIWYDNAPVLPNPPTHWMPLPIGKNQTAVPKT